MTLEEIFKRHDIEPSLASRCGCPEPWLPIVDALLESLVAHGWDRQLAQVKEKFGDLRFYVSGNLSNTCREMISRAELACRQLCIDCGSKEDLEEGAWCCIRCPTCSKQYQERISKNLPPR